MKEKKTRFIYNAVILGAFLGVVFGISEALFLIVNKKSLFEAGVVKLGLLFDGVLINIIAGIILALVGGIFLILFTPLFREKIKYAILSSFLFSVFIVTIVSIKINIPIYSIQRKFIPFIIILTLSFLIAALIFNKNKKLANHLDMVIQKLCLISLGTFFITFLIGFFEGMVNKQDKDISRPNIMVIMIDAARPDRFSCYGYERNTTPNIDKIAKGGTLFRKAHAHANWTTPSTATLFTGKYLSQMGVGNYYTFLDSEYVTIAELLAENGYETVAFTNSPWISKKTNLAQGFNNYFDMGERFEEANYFSFYRVHLLITAFVDKLRGGNNKGTRKTAYMVRKWLKNYNFKKPFFMFTHVIDPHTFYHPPKPYDYLFLDKSIDYKKMDQRYLLCGEGKDELSDKDIEIFNALYDASLAYCDSQMQTIFVLLEKMRIIDNTMIVILADHGTYIFELLNEGHYSPNLKETLLRIPLIVKYPRDKQMGQPSVVDDRVVGLVDIFPTLCEVAEVDIVKEEMELRGDSLLNLPAECVLIAETNEAKCIIRDDMKLIVNTNKDNELYNLRLDPNEQQNLMYERRGLSLVLGRELDSIVSRYKLVDLTRKRKVDFNQSEVSKLKSLGYLQ